MSPANSHGKATCTCGATMTRKEYRKCMTRPQFSKQHHWIIRIVVSCPVCGAMRDDWRFEPVMDWRVTPTHDPNEPIPYGVYVVKKGRRQGGRMP